LCRVEGRFWAGDAWAALRPLLGRAWPRDVELSNGDSSDLNRRNPRIPFRVEGILVLGDRGANRLTGPAA
jgi:hypothetical protein